jgi:hypothetical protein
MPVLLTVNLNKALEITEPIAYTNWREFQDKLATSRLLFPFINSPNSLENAVNKLTNKINDAIKNSSQTINKDRVHKLPSHIRNLIKQRNSARKIYQFLRTPASKLEYNSLCRTVKEKIRKFNQEQWSDFISGLSTQDNSLWKFQKRLRNKGSYNFPPIHGNHGTAFDPAGKAEAIADTYEKQFAPNENLVNNEHDNEVNCTLENFLNQPPSSRIEKTTINEVREIIKHLKNSKAPGIDKITNKAIKNFPPNILIYLTAIINGILKLSYFPANWKTSVVCPIPKPGANLTIPESYRPISLLSSLSKIAEHVILNRLKLFIDSNNIILPEQFGFREKHSTTHQLLRVVELASEGLQTKTPTGAIFLDIAKAFDRISHPGLIYKLIKLNVPDALTLLLHNYLCDRNFTVRVKNKYSSNKNITAGVLQGSLLAPTLFNLYINDIPRNDLTTLALYADDTAIITTAPHINCVSSFIQHHLNALEPWFVNWKIKVNPTKCHAIYFSHSYKTPPRLYLNGEVISWENSVKYLGVTLDKKLTWKPHINEITKKMKGKTESLRMLLFSPKLNIRNKLLLYKQIILPTALYAAEIWSFAAKTNLKQIEVIHNKTLRRITRTRRYVRNDVIRNTLNMLTFKQYCVKQAKNFYNKIGSVPNEIIAELPDYDYGDEDNRKRPKATMLSE